MSTSPTAKPNYPSAEITDPKNYRIEQETDKFRVLYARYLPGDKTQMHSHPNTVAIFLTDVRARFTFPDGKTQDVFEKAGTTHYYESFVHAAENVGSNPFELVLVEMKA